MSRRSTPTPTSPSPSSPRSATESGPAVFSDCRRYRYVLRRNWVSDGPLVNFVLLNPSTADESQLDPTLRRCMGFARAWGCRGMVITNIFALRSTCPSVLRTATDPVGPDNDGHLRHEARSADLIVLGWGNHGSLRDRSAAVLSLLDSLPLRCLKTTGAGHPTHPLYLPATSRLSAFSALVPVRA